MLQCASTTVSWKRNTKKSDAFYGLGSLSRLHQRPCHLVPNEVASLRCQGYFPKDVGNIKWRLWVWLSICFAQICSTNDEPRIKHLIRRNLEIISYLLSSTKSTNQAKSNTYGKRLWCRLGLKWGKFWQCDAKVEDSKRFKTIKPTTTSSNSNINPKPQNKHKWTLTYHTNFILKFLFFLSLFFCFCVFHAHISWYTQSLSFIYVPHSINI